MPDPLEHNTFISALRQHRATSPATARPLADLPPIPEERLRVFLDAEIIREGAPGTFYVEDPAARREAARSSRRPYTPVRVALMVAVWVVVLLVPLLVWLFAR